MKTPNKLLLLIIFTLSCFAINSVGQQTINPKYFVGYWVSAGTTARVVVFKDVNEHFQMVACDTTSGEEVHVTKIEQANDTIKTNEYYKSTDWTTYNTYTFIDENTLKDSLAGAANGAVIYFKRLK
jgi:NADH:ubiquinone oxidoreductase subunit